MNNYSVHKLWNTGAALRKSRVGKSWIEITSSDEWDEFTEKHEITPTQMGIIRQGFFDKPIENPEPEAETIIPFGVHKDTPMRKLPLDYLLYLRKQEWIEKWPTVNSWLARHKEQLDKDDQETKETLDDLKEFGKALKGDY